MTLVDEFALIRRVAAKDRQAFEELYRLYHRRLFRFLLRYTQRLDLVEEILNDVMFVVWQRADRFGERSRLSTWIFGIAYRTALKRLRSVVAPEKEVAVEETHLIEHAGPERSLSRKEHRTLLNEAMSQLSPVQRAVVELTYFHGYSYPEISEILDCPTNTVKTRMFHARRRLRQILPKLEPSLAARSGARK